MNNGNRRSTNRASNQWNRAPSNVPENRRGRPEPRNYSSSISPISSTPSSPTEPPQRARNPQNPRFPPHYHNFHHENLNFYMPPWESYPWRPQIRHRSQPPDFRRRALYPPPPFILNEQQNRLSYEARMQNFFVDNDEELLCEMAHVTVNDMEEEMEQRQNMLMQFIAQGNPPELMTSEDTVCDQSTWIAEPRDAEPPQFDALEPILASSFGSGHHESVLLEHQNAPIPSPRRSILPSSGRGTRRAASAAPIPAQRRICVAPPAPAEPSVFQAILDLPDLSMAEEEVPMNQNQEEPPVLSPQISVDPVRNAHYIKGIRTEDVLRMSLGDAQAHGLNMWNALPHIRYRSDYPFVASGVIQKCNESPNQLWVYSARMGKLRIADHEERKDADDYVYFLALGPERFVGCSFMTHENNMISTKFPAPNIIEIKVYAMVALPLFGDTTRHALWICWSDQLGMMRLKEGAARNAVKKAPNWRKQLDIVSVQAMFENGKFIVKNLVALTNTVEKKSHFPSEVFLVPDAQFRGQKSDDLVFYSHSLDLLVSVSTSLCGRNTNKFQNRQFQIVAAPTFENPTSLVFRALTIIENGSFWDADRQWLREQLMSNTEEYRVDARCRNSR